MDKIDPKLNRDVIAAYLSLLPGLGHVSKHHFGMGFAIMLMGTPVVLFITGLLAAATLGVALLVVPAMWWIGVAMHAFTLADRSRNSKPALASPAD